MRSVSVVLPESMWALIPMLRSFVMSSPLVGLDATGAAAKERRSTRPPQHAAAPALGVCRRQPAWVPLPNRELAAAAEASAAAAGSGKGSLRSAILILDDPTQPPLLPRGGENAKKRVSCTA